MQGVWWYRQAAEQGDTLAQVNLGYCYEEGEGVSKSLVQAISWYRKAADQGVDYALHTLGNCYAEGKGVAKDEIEAHAYYNLAGATYERSREKLAVLEKQMTPDRIAAGKNRAKELQKEIDAKIAAKAAGK